MPADQRPGILRRHTGLVTGAVWLAVYVLVCVTGQRFNTAYLGYGWQLTPWDILTDDPLRSVWYLHVQPPLWNLALGGTAWASPFHDAITLQVLMAAFGVLAAAWAARLARMLGLRPGAALAVALVATLQPEVLKGAFEPTYELAVGALLLGTVVAVGRFVSAERATRASTRAALVLALVGTAVVMTRSLYHPAWLLIVLGLSWWATTARRERVDLRLLGVMVLIPLVVVGGWMVKNEVLFGRPTLSSWFGMNLQRAVIPVLDSADLQAMYEESEVSDIAMIGPFGNFGLYAPYPPADTCVVEHSFRSLSEPGRTTDPVSPNFNYECFLPVFDQAGEDAWAVIRAHPGAYVEGRLWSGRVFFGVSPMPSESPSGVLRGLDAVYSLGRLDYSGVISTDGWGTPIYGTLEAPTDFGIVPIIMYVGIGLVGAVETVRVLRRRATDPLRRADEAMVAVTGITAAVTFFVGIAFELGEQARFRTMTDPLVWLVALALVLRLSSQLAEPPSRTSRQPPPPAGTDDQPQEASVGR